LKALRAESGMSQQAIADRAKIAKQHYQRLEWGTVNPTVGTLIKVAKAFRISLGELLDFVR